MSISRKRTEYHHGDLRAALVAEALRALEAGEASSLRALARSVGVSPAAPYRHFADRTALESALAAEGFRQLRADLLGEREPPSSAQELTEFGVRYVDFALRRPHLFRLMVGNPCDDEDDDRATIVAELRSLLGDAMTATFPHADADALAVGCWSTAHGLAYLHLDGKLAPGPRREVLDRVRAAFRALLAPTPASREAHDG